MEEPTPGTCGIIKSEISEFFADEWYVAVDGMEAVVNGEVNAYRAAAAPDMLAVLERWVALLEDTEIDNPDLYALMESNILDAAVAALAKARGEARNG